MPIPLTGIQYHLQAGDYQAIITELGAGLRNLMYRGEPMIVGYDPDELPPGSAGQLLAPWPNRIDQGRYTFGGKNFQLDLNEPTRSNAIHGFTRWVSWTPTTQAPDDISLTYRLLGRPGYPFCLELSVNYRLDASAGLRVTITAQNVGSQPAPYGTGAHPYLMAEESFVDTSKLELPASSWLPINDRNIPAGPLQDVAGTSFDFRTPRVIGSTKIDHAFTGLVRDGEGHVLVSLTSRRRSIGLWAGPGYNWLQVFTGDSLAHEWKRCGIAIEPMTCPPNSFSTGEGRLTLAPTDSVTHTWGVKTLDS
jgi:aldose 1-epimerase